MTQTIGPAPIPETSRPEPRPWLASWAAELHPAFCAHPLGCGVHTSAVTEVDTGYGPFVLAAAEMDADGRLSVPLVVETAGSSDEVRLTVAAAEHLGLALLAKVSLARHQIRMAPAALLDPPTTARTATGPACPPWCVGDPEWHTGTITHHNSEQAIVSTANRQSPSAPEEVWVAVERDDQDGQAGPTRVWLSLGASGREDSHLTPADARVLAAALVRAADLAEGRCTP